MSRLRHIDPIRISTTSARGVTALILLAATFASLTVLARYLNTGFTITQQV